MVNRIAVCLLLVCSGAAASPTDAAAQQTLNFTLGYVSPRGEDARDDDVLTANRNFLVFDIEDFGGATVGAEYLIPVGQYIEAGAGIGFSRRTVPTLYEDFIDSDGSEIEQDLKLRVIPMAFTFRILPLGQSTPVQPYFGAGIGLFSWRYSESGEFVDFNDRNAIFREQYVANGTATGPVVLGGIRFASDAVAVGGEIRYQSAKGDLDRTFAADTIDLGSWNYLFTFGLRF